MAKLARFPTWTEAREAKRLMEIVYAGDEFFIADDNCLYSGTYEKGGRALYMRSVEIASDEIAYT